MSWLSVVMIFDACRIYFPRQAMLVAVQFNLTLNDIHERQAGRQARRTVHATLTGRCCLTELHYPPFQNHHPEPLYSNHVREFLCLRCY